jgi:hypothetical protein
MDYEKVRDEMVTICASCQRVGILSDAESNVCRVVFFPIGIPSERRKVKNPLFFQPE